MRAILQKKMQRDAVGKPSAFRVRGKSVTAEEVWKYFRRKGVLHPELMASSTIAATPEAVECWTPPPSPKPIQHVEEGRGMRDVFQSSLPSFDDVPLDMEAWMPNGEFMTGGNHQPGNRTLDQMRRLFSFSPEMLTFEMPRSPLPPQSLLVPEQLFFNIRAYFNSSFSSGSFFSNDKGNVVRVNEPEEAFQHLRDFQGLCIMGSSMLFGKSFVEGRRLLSKACATMENIINEQHPRALDYILYTLSTLKSDQRNEVVTLLRNHIGRMAAQLFAVDHPWGQILSLMGIVEEPCLRSAMGEAFKCSNDALKHHVGQFHRDVLKCYCRYINVQFDPTTAEKLLLDLLEKAEQEYENSDHRISNLRGEYAWCLYGQRRYIEAVEIINCEFVPSRDFWKLEILAWCFYQMGQTYEAEMKIREAIESAEQIMGRNHPEKLDYMLTLSDWLLEWGRVDESNQLKGEITSLIEPDDIDAGGREL